MSVIYPSPIFGPVISRRLGISLGINLMPSDGKMCTFDCIYCECGLNAQHRPSLPRPTRQQVAQALEQTLRQMAADGQQPDVLTFAGNGEPTAHPQFADIITDTILLRDRLCPKAKVSVLSNSTMIHRDSVRQALMKIENNILKLDTVNPNYINKVDRPTGHYSVADIVEQMKRFNGHLIIQTMFMQGTLPDGSLADNTGDEYVTPWLQTVADIAPQSVMIYTIDRDTPVGGLLKATPQQLDAIRDRVRMVGIPCTASY